MEMGIRNSLETAETIHLSDRTSILTGNLNQSDRADLFCFNLFHRSNFNLNLTGLTANADVVLLNSREEEIAISEVSGTSDENISTNLNPGQYFVRVSVNQPDNTAYNLSLVATLATPEIINNNELRRCWIEV